LGAPPPPPPPADAPSSIFSIDSSFDGVSRISAWSAAFRASPFRAMAAGVERCAVQKRAKLLWQNCLWQNRTRLLLIGRIGERAQRVTSWSCCASPWGDFPSGRPSAAR